MVERRVSWEEMEEGMERRRYGAAVRDRIRRLNPNTFPVGAVPRGLSGRWHNQTINACRYVRDICTRERFEQRWGAGSYRLLTDHDLVRMGGKRRAVSRFAFEDGPRLIEAKETTT